MAENFAGAPAEYRAGHHAEKFFDATGSPARAAVGIEKQQAVFESGHHLIQIFAQGAENFANVAQLLSDIADLRADQAQFVGRVHRLNIELTGGDRSS